jgi:hypothetical protein
MNASREKQKSDETCLGMQNSTNISATQMRVRHFARRDTLLLFFLLPLLAHCFGHVCVCVPQFP